MPSQVDDYASAYVILKLKDPGFPDAFLTKPEALAIMEERVAEHLSPFRLERLADVKMIANTLFDAVEKEGGFQKENDSVLGDFFKLNFGVYKTLRQNILNGNELIEKYRKIGDRYFPEVFSILEREAMQGPSEPALPSSHDQGVILSDSAEAELVPASDRLVHINHNSPEYQEIKDGIANAIEEVSNLQTNEISHDAKRNATASLKSVADLLDAADLSLIQIKVGVIMAVELAQEQAKLVFKSVAGSLLVDAIKAFFKTYANLDF